MTLAATNIENLSAIVARVRNRRNAGFGTPKDAVLGVVMRDRDRARLMAALFAAALGFCLSAFTVFILAMIPVWLFGGVVQPMSLVDVVMTAGREAGGFILKFSGVIAAMAFLTVALAKTDPIPGLCVRCEYPLDQIGDARCCPECGAPATRALE